MALCLGASACSNDLLERNGAGTSKEKPGQRAAEATEKSVKAFYVRASQAYRTRDADQLCRMTHKVYAAAMVEEAAGAGVDVSTCPEVWRVVFDVDPQGHKDKITNVAVKGKTATFLSGDDPWRLRLSPRRMADRRPPIGSRLVHNAENWTLERWREAHVHAP